MSTELNVQETIKERYDYEREINGLKDELEGEVNFEKIEFLEEEINKIYSKRIFNYRYNIKSGLTTAIFSLMEMIDVTKNRGFKISGFDFTKEALSILLNDLRRCRVMIDGIHGPKKDKYPELYGDPVFKAWEKEKSN